MVDWSRVRFTEHMVEVAAVVGECEVAFDFEGHAQTCYQVKVLRAVKGASPARFFAVARSRIDPAGYAPMGEGESPEAALEACLAEAGVHLRRRVQQGDG